MLYRNLLYALTTVIFTVILGAAIYEHVAVWPSQFAAPPRSLTFFQGEYQLNAASFWKMIHPVALLLLAATLVLHWNTPRRKFILIPMLVYVLILVITFIYFVPELLAITGAPYSNEVNAGLQKRGSTWINLSLIRAIVLAVIMVVLNFGLSKPSVKERGI